ncbi:MAG: cytochrome c [Rhizobacter sp.]|nr:cytochrome c [Chlorobiales bacterium]
MKPITFFISTLAVAAVLTGCQGGYSKNPPIRVHQNMETQPKYKPQAQGKALSDGGVYKTTSTMQAPVAGTVARGEQRSDYEYYNGMSEQGDTVQINPVAITPELLARGGERYTIYCAPCHGGAGNGGGIMVEHGYVKPPTYHDTRLRTERDGHIFTVISNGIRNMQGYKTQIPVADRWAIVSYVRVLQRSQNAVATDVPEDKRESLK